MSNLLKRRSDLMRPPTARCHAMNMEEEISAKTRPSGSGARKGTAARIGDNDSVVPWGAAGARGPRGLATARLLRASQAGYCPNGLMRVSPDVAEKSATLRVASSWPPATQMPAI